MIGPSVIGSVEATTMTSAVAVSSLRISAGMMGGSRYSWTSVVLVLTS